MKKKNVWLRKKKEDEGGKKGGKKTENGKYVLPSSLSGPAGEMSVGGWRSHACAYFLFTPLPRTQGIRRRKIFNPFFSFSSSSSSRSSIVIWCILTYGKTRTLSVGRVHFLFKKEIVKKKKRDPLFLLRTLCVRVQYQTSSTPSLYICIIPLPTFLVFKRTKYL